MADITLHVDEYLDEAQRQRLLERLCAEGGVHAVTSLPTTPKFVVIDYDSSLTSSQAFLHMVSAEGLRGELIGL
jgi:hypothetical protein